MKSRTHSRLSKRSFAIGTALTAIMLGCAVYFGLQSRPARATSPAMTAAPVSVAIVGRKDVVTWDEFSGRLEAVERVDIRPRVSGAIQSVHFREGAIVKRGDLLVRIDPGPYAAAVDRAEALVASAQARLSYAQHDQARAQRLLDEQAIAQREYDDRLNALQQAGANLRAEEAALSSARLDLGYTDVRAPVAGRMGKLEVTAGNLVAAGPDAPVLTTLLSVSPIYASFDADERVVSGALRESSHGSGGRERMDDTPVQIETASTAGTPISGRLQLIDNRVDAKSGTVRVRAVFDNKDGRLMPGQFAKVRMGQSQPRSVLLINERAVGTDQDKRYVMVVGADNKVAYRELGLGGEADGLRIITSGVTAGERVVLDGLQRLKPGSLVAPELVPMDVNAKPSPHRTAAPA
jgi:multidrug efflux system membrane fusion protein